MVALPPLRGFGGMVPKLDPEVLPDNMAELAYNCDLTSGALDGLTIPTQAANFTSVVTAVRKAYRFPNPSVGLDFWIDLPSEYSSVVRSPLANDTDHRIYWTNPGDTTPHWSTFFRVSTGLAHYDLGTIQPDAASGGALTVGAAGGTLPPVYRSYCYTYINEFDEESAPNYPSTVVSGPSDATWTVTGLPTVAPSNPAGRNYPAITKLRVYRTVTGASTGAQFYQIHEFDYTTSPPTSPWTDTVADNDVLTSGLIPLITSDWANPPDGLDGLTRLPGGMLAGFIDNTIYFCEPNRPHAWPASYDQSLGYKIVGLTVWQQVLVVLTEGFPSTGSGNTPSNFVFTTVRAAEPCIARGSIVTDLSGVYYASQNGLIQLSGYGAQNQTLQFFTKNVWVSDYLAADIVACRHRTQYMAINGSGVAFFLDYAESRSGVVKLNTFTGVTSIWNDEYSGDTYFMGSDKKAYLWDNPDSSKMNYRWRSKLFLLPAPTSLGACFISVDPEILTATNPGTPPFDNGDTNLQLPTGVNAVFKLYRGAERTLVLTRNLRNPIEIFRLPSGAKAHHWQCEVVSRVRVKSIELASTMKELRGV